MASGHVNRANRPNTWPHQSTLHVNKTVADAEDIAGSRPITGIGPAIALASTALSGQG